MQGSSLTVFQRVSASAVDLVAATVSLIVCVRKARVKTRGTMFFVLGGYILIISGLFLFGALSDDGFGWAFLPLMVITAPCSFFAAAPFSRLLDRWGIDNWIGPLLMNFVVLVVVCGGLNTLALYYVMRSVADQGDRSHIT